MVFIIVLNISWHPWFLRLPVDALSCSSSWFAKNRIFNTRKLDFREKKDSWLEQKANDFTRKVLKPSTLSLAPAHALSATFSLLHRRSPPPPTSPLPSSTAAALLPPIRLGPCSLPPPVILPRRQAPSLFALSSRQVTLAFSKWNFEIHGVLSWIRLCFSPYFVFILLHVI